MMTEDIFIWKKKRDLFQRISVVKLIRAVLKKKPQTGLISTNVGEGGGHKLSHVQ